MRGIATSGHVEHAGSRSIEKDRAMEEVVRLGIK